ADRADDRQLIGHAGQFRQALAELDAGDGCADRLPLAADLGRRQRFGIEGLVVRRTAVEPDQNATLRLAASSTAGRRRRLRTQGADQPSTYEAPKAQLQAIASLHSFAVSGGRHSASLSSAGCLLEVQQVWG